MDKWALASIQNQISKIKPFMSGLREEEKARNLWFGNRSGAFEEIKDGVAPSIISIPELKLRHYVFICKNNSRSL